MVFYLYGPERKNLGSSANFGPAPDGGGGCGQVQRGEKLLFPSQRPGFPLEAPISHRAPRRLSTGAAAPLFLSLLET